MLRDCTALGFRDVIGLGIPDSDDRLDGRADSFEDGIPGSVSDRQMEARIALHESAVVHRLCTHLIDGPIELQDKIIGFVGGRAARAFHLDQDANVHEIIKIAFAEQKPWSWPMIPPEGKRPKR